MELAIDEVSKRYGSDAWAVRDVSLLLKPGVVGLLGPNGAGKSSLMRILATTAQPTGGTITWNGVDITRHPNVLRRVLGYLPQEFGVYPNLTAIEFLTYLAAAKGLERRSARDRIDQLLELLHLTDVAHRSLGRFSGGMRRRVGIAQALLNDPQLLIMDEPTAGLDPEERMHFRNLISELATDRIVLLSTHVVTDIEATASTVAVIAQGRLLLHALPEDLMREVHDKVWGWVVPSDTLPAIRSRYRVGTSIRRADGVHVRVLNDDSPHPDAQRLAPTLEDAYLHAMTEREATETIAA